MQTTKDKLAGNWLPEITDFGLAMATFHLIVVIVGY
jgi:hypothetical protein